MSSGNVVWQWDENGVWKAFPPKVEAELESQYKKDKNATFTTNILGKTYSISLSRMTQMNMSTGYVRRITRLVNGAPTPVSGFSSANSGSRPSETYKPAPVAKAEIEFPPASEADYKGKECAICMDDLTEDTKPIKMKECVGHAFHYDCIREAMVTYSTFCFLELRRRPLSSLPILSILASCFFRLALSAFPFPFIHRLSFRFFRGPAVPFVPILVRADDRSRP